MTFAKRRLGHRQVCPIGFGCMSLSWAYGYQPPDEVGEAMLQRALELGYDHLDTARLYGKGHNEALIGRALRPLRDRFFLASKAGIAFGSDRPGRAIDGRPETLRAACEDSLRILQTDHIDLYYLHRLDVDTPVEESVGGLAELVKEGKIGGIGLSEVSAATLRRAVAEHPITAVQNEYSPWTRNPELGLLEACRELDITLVAFSPLGRGALANGVRDIRQLHEKDFRNTMPRFLPENWNHNLNLIDQFVDLAHAEGVTPAQLSLAWVLAQGEHIVAIPGTSKPEHLEENIARWQWQPSPAVLDKVSALLNHETVLGHRYSEAMRANIDTEEFP